MTGCEVVDLPADRLPGDLLLVPIFADQRPLDGPAAVVDWRLDGAVTRLLLAGDFAGKVDECLGMQTNAKFAASRVVLVGGGRWAALDGSRYRTLIRRLLQVAEKAGARDASLCLPPAPAADAFQLEQMVRAELGGCRRLAGCRLSRVARFR